MTAPHTTTYSVPEISCGHCKDTIEAAVGDLVDVEIVTVDVDAKTVAVVGGTSASIIAAIEDVGFDVER